jgi:hypothetical protein
MKWFLISLLLSGRKIAKVCWISVPGVRVGCPGGRIGEEELQGATPGGELFGALKGPKYSIFSVLPLCHLLSSEIEYSMF